MNCSWTSNQRTGTSDRLTGVALAILALVALPLSADTVVLRNGQQYTNVKTKVRGGRIYITSANRRTRSVDARDVKSIVPAEVNWPAAPTQPKVAPEPTKIEPKKEAPKKEEPKKEAPKTTPKSVPTETKTDGADWTNSRWVRMAEGALPLWSGMYRRDQTTWGLFFSGMEAAALAYLIPYLPQPQGGEREFVPTLTVASFLVLPPGAAQPPPGQLGPFNSGFFRDSFVLVSQLGLVVRPGGSGTMQRQQYDNRRLRGMIFLAAALGADALASAFLPLDDGAAPQATSGGTSLSVFALPVPEARGAGVVAGVRVQF